MSTLTPGSIRPLTRRRRSLVLMLLAVALLAGCSLLPGGDPLADTAWRVDAIDSMPPVAGSQPTLRFEDGQAGGSTGCNSFGGAYSVAGDRLTIEPLSMTEMACQAPLDAQEATILAILGSEMRFVLADDRLELIGAEGSLMLQRSADGS